MPLIDKIREKKLIELAKTRFDPNLTPAELKVLHDSANSEELPYPAQNAPRPVHVLQAKAEYFGSAQAVSRQQQQDREIAFSRWLGLFD